MGMKIKLLSAEVQTLMQHVEGQGGWQSLFRRLQNGYDPKTGIITVSDDDVDRLRGYCNEYGDGGWQGRLRQIFRRTLGPELNG
jgi:hypothetical protein